MTFFIVHLEIQPSKPGKSFDYKISVINVCDFLSTINFSIFHRIRLEFESKSFTFQSDFDEFSQNPVLTR